MRQAGHEPQDVQRVAHPRRSGQRQGEEGRFPARDAAQCRADRDVGREGGEREREVMTCPHVRRKIPDVGRGDPVALQLGGGEFARHDRRGDDERGGKRKRRDARAWAVEIRRGVRIHPDGEDRREDIHGGDFRR